MLKRKSEFKDHTTLTKTCLDIHLKYYFSILY